VDSCHLFHPFMDICGMNSRRVTYSSQLLTILEGVVENLISRNVHGSCRPAKEYIERKGL
jgi:hypothetical protein